MDESSRRNSARPSLRTGKEGSGERIKRLLVGPPRDLNDSRIFHRISLIAFLAWIGLGADGLSSSCYGPEEAFRTLGEHKYLAILLAAAMAFTVTIIAIAYSRVIEHFPFGGGGYVVSTKLLGSNAGMVSGSALLVDYVLTIAISIAAAGDALFSFFPVEWRVYALPAEVLLIVFLTLINLRGVKESIIFLAPIFILFLITHLVLIGVGIAAKAALIPAVFSVAGASLSSEVSTLGLGAVVLIFLHSYSLGGGTYTGIEAVSNGLPIMREPHVQTGKRTMLLMGSSLAFTAAGLLFCYLLWNVEPVAGKTMNAAFAVEFIKTIPLGHLFVLLTLISEGALLVVAAQAGFVDGPRVLANMANDWWMPRRFASLSDRLTIQNGVLLMAATALAALLYTNGDVRRLVIMYSINVFLTFSMTELSMCKYYISNRNTEAHWIRKISIHVIGLAMCSTILVIVASEKFFEGGWITMLVTGFVVAACFWIKSHYRTANEKLEQLSDRTTALPYRHAAKPLVMDRSKPTAAVLVGGYNKLGIYTLSTALREFPRSFSNVVFLSAGVVDSGTFKGREAIDGLKSHVAGELEKLVALMDKHGIPSTYRMAVGTDAIAELERLCRLTAEEYPRVTFFAGQVVFQKERWYQSILHNNTAFTLQKRLQLDGHTLVILPAVV